GDLRGARHRLARPGRAGAGRRGRLRRRAQGRGHEGAQDRRRRDRPDRQPGGVSSRATIDEDAAPMKRRVVVPGLGAVTPMGVGAAALYERWAAGECGIVDGAGACTDFEPSDFLSVKQARRLDRFSQFALVASAEALEQAGWGEELPYDPMRVGCISASGGHAIGGAMRMIQYGDADAVVAGGAEATLTTFGFACFNSMQALSPTGISRPFDLRRDGFVMGEGAGVLVLENAEAARERGATILGEVI